jgi:hypothetical protein
MRRALPLVLALAALALPAVAVPAAAAPASLWLTTARGTWIGVDRTLYVQLAWSPAAQATDVAVTVRRRGQVVGRVTASSWYLGHKIFGVILPGRTPRGGTLSVTVRASSSAGRAIKTVSVST